LKGCVQSKLKSIDYYCQKRFTEREREIEKTKARERRDCVIITEKKEDALVMLEKESDKKNFFFFYIVFVK
jgi:hypothetical protein